MARLSRFIILAVTIFFACASFATTYYIAANGSDSNNGTSKSTPWLHAPGMIGCSANCALIDNGSGGAGNAQPGDRFILRGGDVWHSSSFPWTWRSSGNSSSPIYLGVDKTWWNSSVCGSSSWCRPVLNLDNNSGPAFQWGGGGQAMYAQLDNIEFVGLFWPSGSASYVQFHGGTGLGVTNSYFHSWTHAAGGTDGCQLIVGDLQDTGNYVAFSVFDGSDSTNGGDSCYAVFAVLNNGSLYGNVFTHLSNMYVGQASRVHDNLFDNLVLDYAPMHGNMFENNGSVGSIIYNNVFRYGSQAGSNVTFWDNPSSPTAYYFNNLVMDSTTANVWDIVESGDTVVMFNNTLECGADTNPTANCTGNTHGIFNNNHFITSGSSLTSFSSQSNNIVQTKTVANGQGYTISNNFMPTTSGNATVNTGVNMTSTCNTIAAVDAAAGAACQKSATLACSYNQANHTVACPAANAVARPTSGSWNVGAYQFSDTPPPTALQPPTGLNAIAH